MQSTLSTGLNKNEEYIKENCINNYVRQVTFKNNEKVHLDEDTAIPASEIPIRRYIRCNRCCILQTYKYATLTCDLP